ncbi:hypothetical protein Afil01_68270 [Actinorhabdospora filicis]|uniref:Trypsin-co-occurring domain-containing protein n=1 Tax=Actinorhabdospora filicis TaxID=1785913 RepID=A0A9W6SU70_9ACTN|nr:trypco2 family protein [Actinorhabdospora filicis]GLZ82020.1 hypothetical protein Afil01_68270 [Actinorhabdospora filicis]
MSSEQHGIADAIAALRADLTEARRRAAAGAKAAGENRIRLEIKEAEAEIGLEAREEDGKVRFVVAQGGAEATHRVRIVFGVKGRGGSLVEVSDEEDEDF